MIYTILALSAFFSAIFSESYIKFSDTSNPCSNNNQITSIDGSDLSDTLYACIYSNDVTSGTKYYVRFYNPQGDMVYQAIDKTISNNYFYYSISLSLSLIADGDAGDVTYTLKLESSSSQVIVTSGITVTSLLGPIVEDLAARVSAPGSHTEYLSSASDSYGDGDSIHISSQSDNIYFTSVFDSVKNGFTYVSSVEGVQSGYIFTTTEKTISSSYDDNDYFGYFAYFSKSMTPFAADSSIKYTLSLKVNGDIVSTKEVIISIIIDNQNLSGHCEPKKTKSTCYAKTTQSSCEGTSGCKWVV